MKLLRAIQILLILAILAYSVYLARFFFDYIVGPQYLIYGVIAFPVTFFAVPLYWLIHSHWFPAAATLGGGTVVMIMGSILRNAKKPAKIKAEEPAPAAPTPAAPPAPDDPAPEKTV